MLRSAERQAPLRLQSSGGIRLQLQGSGMHKESRMKVLMRLIPIGILALMPFLTLANGREHGKPDERTLNTLKHLDTNSFNSSLKPKKFKPDTVLDQTPFNVYEKTKSLKHAVSATDDERSRVYTVALLETQKDGATVCFIDNSLQGTYLSAPALRLQKNTAGHYMAAKQLPRSTTRDITRT